MLSSRLVGVAAVLWGWSVANSFADGLTKIHFVQTHANIGIGEEIFLYAVPKALGYFKDEGLDVELSGVGGGMVAGQLLQSGRAQFADIVAESLLSMREQGATPVAFSSLKQHNGFSVGLLQDSPIRSLSDLSGKTIGFVAGGTGTAKILSETLRQLGVDPHFQEVSVGTGPQVGTALRSKTVDAVLMWDAVYGLLENQGLKLNHIELPIQNQLAGFAMATTAQYAAENPKIVGGFCRAFNKGLYFTRLNPEAAVKIFFKEFPTVKPADKDEATAVRDAVHIMDVWFSYAEKGVPIDAKTGKLDPEKWDFTEESYTKLGFLKGTLRGRDAMTNEFFEQCNDFDRSAVSAAAHSAAR